MIVQPAQSQRWLRSRWLIGTVAAVVVYTLAGFLLAPALIRWQLIKRLPALTQRTAAVRQVRINPYTLSLTIRGFALTEPDGSEFASFTELYMNLGLVSVLKRGFVFQEIRLTRPAAHLIRLPDGRFNFANLARSQPAEPKPAKPLPLIMIAALRVVDGAITFTDRDRPAPFEQRFGPINLELTRFTTRPTEGSPYSLLASSETGATFAWSGDLTIVPLRSHGTFKLSGLPLNRYAPYLQDVARVDLADGRVDLQADYQFDASRETVELDIARATFQLHNLSITSRDTGQPALLIPELDIQGIEASLARQTAHIGAITSTGGVLQVRVNADGTVDPLSLLNPHHQPATPPTEPVPAPASRATAGTKSPPGKRAWKLGLDQFTLTGYRIKVANEAGLQPSRLSLDQLGLSVTGIVLDGQSNLLDVAAVNLHGLKTTVTILPGAGSNTVAASNALTTANPATTLDIAATSNTIATTPKTVSAAAPASNAAAAGGFQARIGTVTFEHAAFRFTDESVQPPVTSALDDFSGTIQGLSSTLNTTATVDLRGQVNGQSPVAITGKINPLAADLFVDLAISLTDTTLLPTSPYAARYVGFPLENGALSLDLHYFVTRRELKAQNKVRVDQLRLGPASNSPDAIQVPIKLAIALLQDRHGVITLDVPVTGRLDDPKFKLGPIILQVFMNVLVKAVTKPFALLGSLLGSEEDISFVEFEPGHADFPAGTLPKLDTLAKALDQRPALKLAITASVDPVQDRAALARLKLEAQLRSRRAKELETAGAKIPNVEAVPIDPADRDRLLKLLYAEATGLIPTRASPAREATVLAHLQTKQNFAPVRTSNGTNTTADEKTGGELTLADMEAKLLAAMTVTPDDLQTLLQERAAKVRDYLEQSGKIAADRLSIAPPKPAEAGAPDRSRVTFALE